jgi:selenocysteine lyase/cysteine desulfurase
VGVDRIRAHDMELTQAFIDGLDQIPGVRRHGPRRSQHMAPVVSINVDGLSPSDLARSLDRDFGIMTRPGLHCAPRAHQSIGAFPAGAVRFSFGWYNRRDEIDRALEAIDRLRPRP